MKIAKASAQNARWPAPERRSATLCGPSACGFPSGGKNSLVPVMQCRPKGSYALECNRRLIALSLAALCLVLNAGGAGAQNVDVPVSATPTDLAHQTLD